MNYEQLNNNITMTQHRGLTISTVIIFLHFLLSVQVLADGLQPVDLLFINIKDAPGENVDCTAVCVALTNEYFEDVRAVPDTCWQPTAHVCVKLLQGRTKAARQPNHKFSPIGPTELAPTSVEGVIRALATFVQCNAQYCGSGTGPPKVGTRNALSKASRWGYCGIQALAQILADTVACESSKSQQPRPPKREGKICYCELRLEVQSSWMRGIPASSAAWTDTYVTDPPIRDVLKARDTCMFRSHILRCQRQGWQLHGVKYAPNLDFKTGSLDAAGHPILAWSSHILEGPKRPEMISDRCLCKGEDMLHCRTFQIPKEHAIIIFEPQNYVDKGKERIL